MSVYLACYKGKPRKTDALKVKLMHLSDWMVRAITKSPYSHCELAIADEKRPGVYFCVSASIRDGGVRGKYMKLPGDRWDLLVTHGTEQIVQQELRVHRGAKYDWFGVFSFLFPFIRESKKRWFCSEFCAHILSLDKPHRHSPQSLYTKIKESQ